jgi:hypothetical protein
MPAAGADERRFEPPAGRPASGRQHDAGWSRG